MARTAESFSYLQVHNRACKCYTKYLAICLGIDIWERNFIEFCYTSKETTKRINLRPSIPGLIFFNIPKTDCFVERYWLYERLLQRIADRTKSLWLQAVNLGLYCSVHLPLSASLILLEYDFEEAFCTSNKILFNFNFARYSIFPKALQSVGMLFANQSASLANYRSLIVTF
jgi:hypothetical protein